MPGGENEHLDDDQTPNAQGDSELSTMTKIGKQDHSSGYYSTTPRTCEADISKQISQQRENTTSRTSNSFCTENPNKEDEVVCSKPKDPSSASTVPLLAEEGGKVEEQSMLKSEHISVSDSNEGFKEQTKRQINNAYPRSLKSEEFYHSITTAREFEQDAGNISKLTEAISLYSSSEEQKPSSERKHKGLMLDWKPDVKDLKQNEKFGENMQVDSELESSGGPVLSAVPQLNEASLCIKCKRNAAFKSDTTGMNQMTDDTPAIIETLTYFKNSMKKLYETALEGVGSSDRNVDWENCIHAIYKKFNEDIEKRMQGTMKTLLSEKTTSSEDQQANKQQQQEQSSSAITHKRVLHDSADYPDSPKKPRTQEDYQS